MSSSLPAFPKTGISLLLLQNLRNYVQNINNEWTTDDVCKNVILPWTEIDKCSFVTYLEKNHQTEPHPILNITYSEVCHPKANIFISHAWKYKFLDVVAALETYFENNPSDHTSENTYLWFDLVVNDQWGAVILPQIWWKTVFMEAIESIGHTLMVAIPWRNPVTLTRAWCLWELYCTRASKSVLTLQLNNLEVQEFYRQIRQDSGIVFSSLCEIDVEKSQAFKPDDRDMIFEAVRSLDGGFYSVNVEVKSLLRDWIRHSAKELAGKLFTPQSPVDLVTNPIVNSLDKPSSEEVQNSQAAGIVLMDQGQSISSNIFVSRKTNLALCCHREGKLSESQLLFEEVLQYMTTNNLSTTYEYLVCLNNYANLLYTYGKNLEALNIYDQIISGCERLKGILDPMTLDGLNNKAVVLKQLGRYTEAIDILLIAYERKEKVYGLNHPSTLDTINNLGTCYKRIANYTQAEKMYLIALKGYESTLGHDNMTTYDAINNLAILYKVMKLYKESEKYYQRALSGYELLLGSDHSSYLRTCYNYCLLLLELKEYSKSEILLHEIIEKYENIYEKTSPQVLDAKLTLAMTYSKQLNKTSNALELYNDLYFLYKINYHIDPYPMLRYLKLYAEYLITFPGNDEKSHELRQKSKELYYECYEGYLQYYGLTAYLTQNFILLYLLYLINHESVMKGYEMILQLYDKNQGVFHENMENNIEFFIKLDNFLQNGQEILQNKILIQWHDVPVPPTSGTSIVEEMNTTTAIEEVETTTGTEGVEVRTETERVVYETTGDLLSSRHELLLKDILYQGYYNCDLCHKDGFGWGYSCKICNEDYHPLCILRRAES